MDDILVFSKTKAEHYTQLHMVFTFFEKHGLIVSRKKIKLATQNIKILGTKIRQEKITLQPHITSKIL